MYYEELRQQAQDGDFILCKRRALAAIGIRVFTAESFNHLAGLVWLGDGLWVSEMLGKGGHTLTPASTWARRRLAAGEELLWGQAPDVVRGNPAVRQAVELAREEQYPYGHPSLVSVWLSQVFNVPLRGAAGVVCSTYWAQVFEDCGYDGFDRLPDPGDFLQHAVCAAPLHPRPAAAE